ncbi:recombinase family protein [Rhodopirellula sp. JC740]|uniref:Recombinase family protein n=1 Tax=Rhodopirellula halodulae TaxID=2894198 RepID=A0ABS8NDL8_9BACT|nr:recombinase family protein [Rhodopirellula sp. JC740]MCC9641655.1 recombinase family protein [Rhodopirellula sp. JC740]
MHSPAVTAIYARKSRRNESALGSCEVQAAICRDTAEAFSWEIKEVFADDGGSSETLDRPAMSRLIEQIELGVIRRLIVDRADRLSRKLHVMARLMELFDRYEVDLIVVTDPNFGLSAASRLSSNIVAAASEFQLEMTRERMADSRAALKSKGKRVAGPAPFGYRADSKTKQLVQDIEEAVIVREIFQLAADGATPSSIAALANLKRWPDGKGKIGNWNSGRIRDLLNNPVYAGEIRNGDSTLPGSHQAMVSKDTFEAVQRHLEKRRTQTSASRNGLPPVYLTGVVICGSCNRPMSTSTSQRKLDATGKVLYRYYRCRSESGGRPPCPGVSVKVDDLEQMLVQSLADVDGMDGQIPHRFHEHFARMPEKEQLETLPKVFEQIVYKHDECKIQMTFRPDAFDLLDVDVS